MGEVAIAALLCGLLGGGQTEVRQYFRDGLHHIRTDCETNDYVIEMGLDNKPSLRDSVHQAVFASILTGKTPMVVVLDTDGRVDRYEDELRQVTRQLGIAYGSCSVEFVRRWASTAPFRGALDKDISDLPIEAVAQRFCDLDRHFLLSALDQ